MFLRYKALLYALYNYWPRTRYYIYSRNTQFLLLLLEQFTLVSQYYVYLKENQQCCIKDPLYNFLCTNIKCCIFIIVGKNSRFAANLYLYIICTYVHCSVFVLLYISSCLCGMYKEQLGANNFSLKGHANH